MSSRQSMISATHCSQESIYKLFSCAHCHLPFNLSIRTPRLLNCGHTLGADCIASLVESNQACPICSQSITAANGSSLTDVSSLATNTFIIDLLESLPSQVLVDDSASENSKPASPVPQAPPAICSVCKKPKPSTHQCQQCNAMFCAGHAASHEVDHEDDDEPHTLSELSAFAESIPSESKSSKKNPNKCSVHDEDFKYFCQTDAMPVCISCTVLEDGGHSGHKLKPLQQARTTSLEALMSTLPDVDKKAKEIDSCARRFEQAKGNVNGAFELCRTMIDVHFDSLIQRLQNRRQGLLSQCSKALELNLQTLDASLRKIGHSQQHLQSCVNFAKQLDEEDKLSAGRKAFTPSEHLQRILLSSKLREDLEKVSSDSHFNTLWPDECMPQFAPEHPVYDLTLAAFLANSDLQVDLDYFISAKQLLGDLHIASASIQDTHARWEIDYDGHSVSADVDFKDDESIPFAPTEPIRIYLSLRDQSHNVVAHAGQIWSVNIACSDGIAAPEFCIKDEGLEGNLQQSGQYTVSFVAPHAQKFAVTLSCRGASLNPIRFVKIDRTLAHQHHQQELNVVTTSSNIVIPTPAPNQKRLSIVPTLASIAEHVLPADGPSAFAVPVPPAVAASRGSIIVAAPKSSKSIPPPPPPPSSRRRYSEIKPAAIVGAGTFLRSFGSLGKLVGQFENPCGITIGGPNRLLLIADFANHRVQALNSSNLSPVWVYGQPSLDGEGSDAIGCLNRPSYCAFSRDQSLVYVTDTVNHRIVTLKAASGEYVSSFGQEGTGNCEFQYPTGIAVSDSTGFVWITDYANHRVLCMDLNRKPTVIRTLGADGKESSAPGGFSRPTGIAAHLGRVFVCDFGNNRVQVFSEATGKLVQTIEKRDSDNLKRPQGLCVDSQKALLYVTDCSKRVSLFAAAGDFEFRGSFGSSGDNEGQFADATGVCVDTQTGEVFVGDLDRHRISVFRSY